MTRTQGRVARARKILHTLGCLCLLPFLVCFSSAALAQPPSFHVEVKLVTVVATVKDRTGQPAADLERQDFSILAGGVPQDIALFERQTDRALSVVLLFDSSPSVAKELKFEQDSAVRFVRDLLGPGARPDDRLAIYQFSDFVNQLQGFTASPGRLEKAVYSIRTSGGTSVYDALYLAARRLERRDGRRVIVIITDGGDTTSTIKFADALESVQLADAVVYSVIVVPITSDAGRNLGGEHALETMSAATGGLSFLEHSERDLDQTFHQIVRDLRLQYLLGFYPHGVPSGPERFHRIQVRVNRPDVRVLARTGYFSGPDSEQSANDPAPVEIEGGPPRDRRSPAPGRPVSKQQHAADPSPRSIP